MYVCMYVRTYKNEYRTRVRRRFSRAVYRFAVGIVYANSRAVVAGCQDATVSKRENIGGVLERD